MISDSHWQVPVRASMITINIHSLEGQFEKKKAPTDALPPFIARSPRHLPVLNDPNSESITSLILSLN